MLSELPADAIADITGAIEIEEFKKGDILISIGKTCHKLYFIEKGLLRTYCITSDGKEINLEFSMENQFITAMDSFYNKASSEVTIESLEDTRVYSISRDKLYSFYEKYPLLNKIGRILTEENFMRRERWHVNKLCMYSAERYEHLIQNFPDLVKRIPLNHLASYLGMSKEHLSRIRAGE